MNAALAIKLIDLSLMVYEGVQAGTRSVTELLELRDIAARGELTPEYLDTAMAAARASVDAYAEAVG